MHYMVTRNNPIWNECPHCKQKKVTIHHMTHCRKRYRRGNKK